MSSLGDRRTALAGIWIVRKPEETGQGRIDKRLHCPLGEAYEAADIALAADWMHAAK